MERRTYKSFNNSAMKRFFLILTICLVFLVPTTVFAEMTTEEILMSEKWTGLSTGSSLFSFNADGTGKLEINGGDAIDTTWSISGDQVTVNYNFYGNRSFVYTFGFQNDVYCLTAGENGFLVRQSDCEAMLAASRASLEAYPVAIGEPINLGFINLTFYPATLERKISGSKGQGIFSQAASGNKLFVLTASIENLSGSEINIQNILSEITFDNTYTYSATLYVDHSGFLVFPLPALAKGTLYIAAEIPESLADSYTTASVYVSMNDQVTSSPIVISDGDFVFEVKLDEVLAEASKKEPAREMVYFDECPILPKPMSYVDVRESGHSSSSSNGRTTRISYTFSLEFNEDDPKAILKAYMDALNAAGFSIKGNDVISGTTKVATITLSSTNRIEVDIKPGNEKLKHIENKPDSSEDLEEAYGKKVSLGDTLKLDHMQMTLGEQGTAAEIYSSVTRRKNGGYQYYEAQDGNKLFYLTGTFKNTSGSPIDIRNIYGEFTFDDKYTYPASFDGALANSDWFIHDIVPMNEVTYFMYADVPQNVLSSYKKCTARIGFTDDYNYKTVTSGGLQDFNPCDDVFVVEMSNGQTASSSAKGNSQYETLKPGSKGQAVLDARMKLYELGYFRNKPTQTEYTNNMKDYVKKFEKDNGLTQDGILSPEDQEILFSL